MASSPNVPAPTISFGSLFAQYGIDDRPSNNIHSPTLDALGSQAAAFDFENDTPVRLTNKPPTSAYLRPNAEGVFLFSPSPAEPSLVTNIPSSQHSSYAAPEPPVQVIDQNGTPEWAQGGFEERLGAITYDQSTHSTPSKQRSVSGTPAATPLGVGFATPATVKRFRRTVSGLGSPSVHLSTGRIRTLSNDQYSVPPSPSPARRRVDSSTALTTNIPLSRNVSMQSRMFSSASTASFDIASPQLGAHHEMGLDMPEFNFPTMPDLVGSHHPSPQLSQGKSPLTTPAQVGGDVFYASPANLYPSAPGSSLMAGVDQVMGMGSVPNSTSMMSVDSFTQGHYRTNTLDTISETPILEQEQMPQMSFQHYQPTFAAPGVEYPQVPGMHMQYQQGPVIDIGRWQETAHASTAAHVPSTWVHGGAPPVVHSFARTVSSSSVYPDSNMPVSLGMGIRSVSMPGPSSQSSSSSMTIPGMPTAPGTTGLFGSDQDSMAGPSRTRMHSGSSSVLTSPDTPRRTKHPRVGNYMKPGPKPKGTTPKKSRSSSNPVSSPTAGGSINPALIGGVGFGGPIQPPSLGFQAGPSDLGRAQPRGSLTFGGDLVAEAMSRSNSAQHTMPAPAQSAAPQPQLVIQPARAAGADTIVSGLPRSFLEKLYTTYLTTEGSHTGQPIKRFKCLIEGCERNFPRKSAIHSHIQTHLEDKPFQCEAEDCGAAFVRQHDLRRHMRIHSGTKPFPCLCGKGFARGDALHRHRQRGICVGSIVPARTARESPPRYDPYARPPGHIVHHHQPIPISQAPTYI